MVQPSRRNAVLYGAMGLQNYDFTQPLQMVDEFLAGYSAAEPEGR